MTEKPVRRYQLCVEKLETIEDIKKILDVLQIRIDTNNPLFEELEYYFSTEVVPKGYIKLLEKIGYEGLENMTMEEIEIECDKILEEEENND